MSDRLSVQLFGGEPDHFGTLSSEAVELWTRIEKTRCTRFHQHPSEQKSILRASGCLDKLSAVALQISRLRGHHDAIVERLCDFGQSEFPLGTVRGERALTLIADFEGLLLHGRAALDRLAWFVSSELGSPTQSFRRLSTVVVGKARKSGLARSAANTLSQVDDDFKAVFATDMGESLRDLVSHKHSLAEGVETCPAAVRVGETRFLLFDCETRLPGQDKLLALFETTRLAGQFASFVVLNAIAGFLDEPTLAIDAFAPQWENKTVARSQFLAAEQGELGSSVLVLPYRMLPGGVRFSRFNYRPSLWDCAIDVAPPSSSPPSA